VLAGTRESNTNTELDVVNELTVAISVSRDESYILDPNYTTDDTFWNKTNASTTNNQPKSLHTQEFIRIAWQTTDFSSDRWTCGWVLSRSVNKLTAYCLVMRCSQFTRMLKSSWNICVMFRGLSSWQHKTSLTVILPLMFHNSTGELFGGDRGLEGQWAVGHWPGEPLWLTNQ